MRKSHFNKFELQLRLRKNYANLSRVTSDRNLTANSFFVFSNRSTERRRQSPAISRRRVHRWQRWRRNRQRH